MVFSAVVFYSSTITMMHGPINIIFVSYFFCSYNDSEYESNRYKPFTYSEDYNAEICKKQRIINNKFPPKFCNLKLITGTRRLELNLMMVYLNQYT